MVVRCRSPGGRSLCLYLRSVVYFLSVSLCLLALALASRLSSPIWSPCVSFFSPLVLRSMIINFAFVSRELTEKGFRLKNMSIKQTRIRLKIRLLFSAAGLLDSLLSLIFEFSPPTFPSPFSTLSTLSSTITSIVRVG